MGVIIPSSTFMICAEMILRILENILVCLAILGCIFLAECTFLVVVYVTCCRLFISNIPSWNGGLDWLVTSLVASTKSINAGPG